MATFQSKQLAQKVVQKPRLAAIHYAKGFHIDGLLATVCDRLRAEGVVLGGLLQICEREDSKACRSDVHAVDLCTGETFNIWDDNEGPHRTCRLDESGLDAAAAAIDRAIAAKVDLLIVNRFGRAESQGRGLCDRFATAAAAGVACLTCVRESYVEPWNTFNGGMGYALSTDPDVIVRWAVSCKAQP